MRINVQIGLNSGWGGGGPLVATLHRAIPPPKTWAYALPAQNYAVAFELRHSLPTGRHSE